MIFQTRTSEYAFMVRKIKSNGVLLIRWFQVGNIIETKFLKQVMGGCLHDGSDGSYSTCPYQYENQRRSKKKKPEEVGSPSWSIFRWILQGLTGWVQ